MDVQVQQIITCLDTLSKKTENDVTNIKNLLSKKTPNDLDKLHPDLLEGRKEEKPDGHVGVFC